MLYKSKSASLKKLSIEDEYLEEMQGISDATGISLQILMVINFGFDVIMRTILCSSFIYFDKEQTAIGRNTDIAPWAARLMVKYETSILFKVQNQGISFTHVGFAFIPGVLNGFNEQGITVNAHMVNSTKNHANFSSGAVPTIISLKNVLRCTTNLSEAQAILEKNHISRSITILIGSCNENTSLIFEGHPIAKECIREDKSRFTACTMHYRGSKTKPLQLHYDASMLRLNTMTKHLEVIENATYSHFIHILSDTSQGMDRLKSGGKSVANRGTFQSFIFYPLLHKVFISNGKELPISLSGQFVEINL
jgi:predicted choloylglycine hydrolase